MKELVLTPIGHARTTASKRYEAPRQPYASNIEGIGRIILEPGNNFEQALEDLKGIEKIWLIYWFDQNKNWKPKVQVPRGATHKIGVFATRSPHRPNPIGLSLVDLLDVSGLTLHVGGLDLLDHTPILDIKPYLPYAESHPDAKTGWLENAHDDIALTIDWGSSAPSQEIEVFLSMSLPPEFIAEPDQYPLPHPYRRIKRLADSYEIAYGAGRIEFRVDGSKVIIMAIKHHTDR